MGGKVAGRGQLDFGEIDEDEVTAFGVGVLVKSCELKGRHFVLQGLGRRRGIYR